MKPVLKSDIDKSFGKILKKYRVKSGLTQEELSEKLGISLKYISRIENGNSGVKTQTLIRYMNILGVDPALLYKDFMDNPTLKNNNDLFVKLVSLSDGKKQFIDSVVDSLNELYPEN